MKLKNILVGVGMMALLLTSCTNSNEGSNVSTTTIPESSQSTETGNQATRVKPDNLSNSAKLYIVGDSTVDEFLKEDGSVKDTTYFYERCGWGGHIKDYSENLTIYNYGQSGKSSKDYLGTAYYQTITANITAGDFLMIGFGHNDEKSDDAERFTDASKPTTDNTSFKYYLYEKYIKMAQDKGATPILCTPIVRLSKTNEYTGDKVHITSSGDYRQAIVDLGQEKNVKVIDLTTYTKNLYTEIGYDEARYFHAITTGLSQTEPNLNAVDGTHINNYGAKYFDYYIAKELYNDNNCYLGNYIKDNITLPTKANDLKINTSYKYMVYQTPNLLSYVPSSNFTTITESWYGTAYGDVSGDPTDQGNGYIATEVSSGVFHVGQAKESGTSLFKGKITNTSEGIAFCFKQVSINDNFEVSVKAKVLKVVGDGKQDGFGLMLRDGCWLPANDSSYLSNYTAAGIWRNKNTDININFSRANRTAITKSGNTLSSYPSVNDTLEFSIKRTGQAVVCVTKYNGETYTTNYLDFDYIAIDNDYFYIGMFAARGTVVEFTDLVYTKTGQSQGA